MVLPVADQRGQQPWCPAISERPNRLEPGRGGGVSAVRLPGDIFDVAWKVNQNTSNYSGFFVVIPSNVNDANKKRAVLKGSPVRPTG